MKLQVPYLLTIKICFVSVFTNAQTLIWTGGSDDDFYNEDNWVMEGTEDHPASGSIDSGSEISFNLDIRGTTISLDEDQELNFSTSNLEVTLHGAIFTVGSVSNGKIVVKDTSTLILLSGNPLGVEVEIDLQDAHSWVKLPGVGPVATNSDLLAQMTSHGEPLTLKEDVDIDQYYYEGSLIRLRDDSFQPLTLYKEEGLSGDSFGVGSFEIYSDEQLGEFNNQASSFRLERGYVATMAIFQNGTGKSAVYIASEAALELDLPAALNNTVSFVRVMPWNWVTKKGASQFLRVGTTWTYNWNRNGASELDLEYAPMSWGANGASLSAVAEYVEMRDVTHVLGFNESDNCDDQSGQYNNLCQIDVAVPLFKNLMRTGLRLVSPSPRQGGPFGWSKDFRDLAVDTDVRYDVLGVHWYDWGAGNPVNTPFEDPQDVFDRFKDYLDRVYEEHQLPIWITEFNANANRDISVHRGFLELALPYLESLDFIERYDYFEPNPEVADNRTDITYPEFFDEDGNLTEFGLFYTNYESTPSIPEPKYAVNSFLAEIDAKISIDMEIDGDTLFEGKFLTITLSTERSVGAEETLTLDIDLDNEQYRLEPNSIVIPEGAVSTEVKLIAIDDDFVEDNIEASISMTDLSEGINWSGDPLTFVLTSEDEEVVVPLSNADVASFSVFPNPVDNFLTIEAAKKVKLVTLTSLNGHLIRSYHQEESTLNLTDLDSGVYLLRIFSGEGDSTSRLIRKN